MRLRTIETYEEIYNKYWRYGFWYEKLVAVVLWVFNTITLLGCVILLALIFSKIF